MSVEEIARQYDVEIAIRRWLATLIDYFLIVGITLGYDILFKEHLGYIAVIILLYFIFQYLVFESFTGYTLGKFILRIKVVNEYGNCIGFVKGLIRTLLRVIELNPFCGGGLIAGIVVLCSKKKQRIGDMLANTFVIKVKDLDNIDYSLNYNNETFANENKNSVAKVIAIIISIFIVGIIMLGMFAAIATPTILREIKKVQNEKTEKVYSAAGSEYQITLPYDWKEQDVDGKYNYNALVYNQSKDLYLGIISQNRQNYSDEMDLKLFYKYECEYFDSAVKNAIISDPTDLTINGCKAKQFEVEGEVKNIKITYLITLVETDHSFNQLIGWTTTFNYNGNKDELIKMADTFKEISQDK